MPPEELARVIRQRPFIPFTIHLTEGTAYEIRHPEQVLVDRRGTAIVGVAATDAPLPLVERLESVAVLHITRLEPLATSHVAGDGQ